jgi:hypothetical protein
MNSIESVFEVVEYKRNEITSRTEQTWEGSGEKTMTAVRQGNPRWARFKLIGFRVNGELKELTTNSYDYRRKVQPVA